MQYILEVTEQLPQWRYENLVSALLKTPICNNFDDTSLEWTFTVTILSSFFDLCINQGNISASSYCQERSTQVKRTIKAQNCFSFRQRVQYFLKYIKTLIFVQKPMTPLLLQMEGEL